MYSKTTRLTFLFTTLLLWVLALSSCQEDLGIGAGRIGEKPGAPTNLRYEERPGGALISYDLPASPDLRYVQATYTLENGRQMVSKASLYDNNVLVEGYAQAGAYTVTLSAVSVGEVPSDPVTLDIRTGIPNYQVVANLFRSEDHFFETFGGVNALFENPNQANLIVRVFRHTPQQSNGESPWLQVQEQYTNALSGILRVRGELPLENLYGVVVRDQWGNSSDTIQRRLTPWEEFELSTISVYMGIEPLTELNRNGDYTINNNNGAGNNTGPISTSLFDGAEASPYYNTGRQWWGRSAPIPFQFTLDLTRPVQVSRIRMWARNDNTTLYYQATHVQEFELYGSNAPTADGSYDAWNLIGTFEGVRPSGLPFGTAPNAEDIDYARQGEDFEVDWPGQEGYRYFRIRVLSTWNGVREQPVGNALTVAISELKFYGLYLN